MNTSTSAEKEWLKKVQTGKSRTASSEDKKEQKASSAPMGSSGSTTEKRQKRGFKDVAGMDELKTFITESLINVLNNREIA